MRLLGSNHISAAQKQECNQDYFRRSLAHEETLQCGCARVGKRPLSWAVWLGKLSDSKGSLLDRWDLEFSHEHIFFDDSGSNFGFSPYGLFQERSKHGYIFEHRCYSATKVREALRQLSDASIGSYNFLLNNCQDFISKVMDKYR